MQRPGRRRHQLMPQGRASSTCGCRGSGAGTPLTYPEALGPGCSTPAAGVTNLCHRAGRLQLVVAGGVVLAPQLTLRDGGPGCGGPAAGVTNLCNSIRASWACNFRWPRHTVCTRCWVMGVCHQRTQLTLNTGAMVAAARPPASLTCATGASCQLRPSRWRHQLMPLGA